MKTFNFKKSYNLFINKETKEAKARKIRAIGLAVTMKDIDGIEYQLFLQEDLKDYNGMRLNNPKIGVILKLGSLPVFQPLGVNYEALLYKRDKVAEKFSSFSIKKAFYDMSKDWTISEVLEK